MGQYLEGHPRQPLRVLFPALWTCRNLLSPTSAAFRLAPLSTRSRVTCVKSFVLVTILEPLDDPVGPTFRLEGGHNSEFHQSADLPVGGIPIHFSDALVIRGGKHFPVRIGVGEKPPLAKVNRKGVKLVEPHQGCFVVNRGVAQGNGEKKALDRELRRPEPILLHLLKHARNSLTHLAQIPEVRQNPNQQRIAREVESLLMSQLVDRDRRGRGPGARHSIPTSKNPNP